MIAMRGIVVIVLLAATAAAQDDASAFDFVDIRRGGVGEFVDGKLQQISDGVEIALRGADPAAKPMVLAATKIVFTWSEGDSVKPAAIQLEGSVSVDGPQGLITANRADLDLAGNTLTFSGNVQGKSDAIDGFDAERIVYDLKTGNAVMTNLRARGIKLSSGEGASDFSAMNVDRAGSVVSSGGQVKSMKGGVSISLQPGDAKGKPLVLNANEATFAWSGDGGQPTAIAMRGNVRVDGPQGAIRAERGDFNLGKKELVFTGGVNGSLPQLERFDTDKLVYNLASGETLMSNLRAKGLALLPEKKPDEKPAEGAKQSYSRMDVESAPEVSLTGQKLNWMRGGVSLTMHSVDPAQPPMTVKADELTFGYANDEGGSPDRIKLTGGVNMNAPEMFVNSQRADLNLAANALTFTGDVSGNTPTIKDFVASQLTYDMQTRQVSSKDFKAKRVESGTPEGEQKDAEKKE